MGELVSIIIPVKNNFKFTKGCLDSIEANTSQIRSPYEIIVVDNASTDGTMQYLEGLEKSGRIKVIYNKEPQGFPKSNNQAAAIAQGEYLCLLNNDTIVTSEWLEKLLRCLRSDHRLAAVGPMTNHSSGYQAINQQVRYEGNDELYKFAQNFSCEEKYVDFLVFFCCLIRRSVWDELGGLEEAFGKGCYEDNLFCYRALEKGYKLKIANCYIHHFGGKSFTPNQQDHKAWKDYLELLGRNQKTFMRIIEKYKTISLCMIVGDYEKPETLKRCLDSVIDYVDNICIVFNYKWFPARKNIEDYGNFIYPTKFKMIIRKCRKTTYLKWTNFSDMRNKSLKMATGDYVLWLDADDVLLTPQALRDLALKHQDIDVFKCIVKSPTEKGTVETLMHNRFFKNNPAYFFRNSIHEDITLSQIEAGAKTISTNITIHHLGNTNLKDVQRKNKRNLKFLEKEIKSPQAHSLTYYHIVNSLMLMTGKPKQVYANSLRAIKLVDECFDKFKLTKDDPLTPKMWSLRGLCCIHCGQMLAAKQSFHKSWDEWKHPEAAVNLAKIYNDEKAYDKTIAILDECYKMEEFKMANIPFDIRECEVLMLFHLGEAWLHKWLDKKDDKPTEWMAKAEKYYMELLSIEKKYLPALDKLGFIFRQTNRIDQATLIYVEAVNINPHYFHGWSNLGAYEILQKRYQTAKVFLKKALEIKPDYEEAKHNMKMINDILGEN